MYIRKNNLWGKVFFLEKKIKNNNEAKVTRCLKIRFVNQICSHFPSSPEEKLWYLLISSFSFVWVIQCVYRRLPTFPSVNCKSPPIPPSRYEGNKSRLYFDKKKIIFSLLSLRRYIFSIYSELFYWNLLVNTRRV